MKLVWALLLCLSVSVTAQTDPLRSHLLSLLDRIDLLHTYGQPSMQYGLDEYVDLIKEMLSKDHLSYESLKNIQFYITALFERNAYRDGTTRSRILGSIQQELLTILAQSRRGKLLLSVLIRTNPTIALMTELIE